MRLTNDLMISTLKKGSHYDDQIPGFGVRVGKRARTFILVRNGSRKSLGRYPKELSKGIERS